MLILCLQGEMDEEHARMNELVVKSFAKSRKSIAVRSFAIYKERGFARHIALT